MSISGTAQEGETLTASTVPADATVSYKWMQSTVKSNEQGYQDIPGATGKTFELTQSQVGKYVLCEVTGTGEYSGTFRSAPTSAVAAKTTPVTGVTISGTAQVGQTLSTTVEPRQATVSYEWQQADTADGSYAAIDGATSATYELQEAQSGKFIKVKVTGTGKYAGTQTSAATEQVAAAGP